MSMSDQSNYCMNHNGQVKTIWLGQISPKILTFLIPEFGAKIKYGGRSKSRNYA